MTILNFTVLLFLFFFNIQTVTSFHAGRTFFHSKSSLSSIHQSKRINNIPSLYFKNDDTEVRIKKSRVTRSTPIHNLIVIDTLEDFTEALDQSDVVIVRFFAPWCKACASIAPSFHRLARRTPSALFVNVPVTVGSNSPNLHKILNVKTVPYGHIYHKGILVGEMKQTKDNWNVFETAVKHMVQGYCNVDDIQSSRSVQL